MAVTRLRDIGTSTFNLSDLGCGKSMNLTLDSTILRAKCGNAISERYQGITGLSLEVVIETIDPLAYIHPGIFGTLSVFLPGVDPGSGFAGPGKLMTVEGVCTQTVRRFSRNELPSGSYTIRGVSADGVSCPISSADYPAEESGGSALDFIRDIGAFKFTGPGGDDIASEEFCPESIEVTESSSLIEDSCQGELWPTYVGVAGLNITITATGKGVVHGFAGAYGITTCLGHKGIVTFTTFVGSDTDCASVLPGAGAKIERANITSLNITAATGEIAKISLTWTAHGAPGESGDDTKKAWIEIT